MSFTQMRRDDLYALATDNFAVDVEQTATKPQIIAALAENGVTWEMAQAFDKNAAAVAEAEELLTPQPAPGVITAAQTKAEPVVTTTTVTEEVVTKYVPPVASAPVLLKMERANPRYDIRGYKFTRENPFAVVSSEDADYILTHDEGFKIASPREAQEYYS